jgi:hypothetical protein
MKSIFIGFGMALGMCLFPNSQVWPAQEPQQIAAQTPAHETTDDDLASDPVDEILDSIDSPAMGHRFQAKQPLQSVLFPSQEIADLFTFMLRPSNQ